MASVSRPNIDSEYVEHRREACKKEIKTLVKQCTKCNKSYHVSCANKHKSYDKRRE